MVKKVKFGDLKPGTFFKYRGVLRIKDDDFFDGGCSVSLKNGHVSNLFLNANVQPVTVKITVKG